MKEKLEARKAAVEEEQKALEAQFEELKKARADLDRKASAIQARFQGNVRVLNEIGELIKEPEAPDQAPEA